MIECRSVEKVPVVTLALLQLPLRRALNLNVQILAKFGEKLAKRHIQGADVLHSTGLYPTGFIVSQWTSNLDTVHVTQATGSDVNVHLRRVLATEGKSWLRTVDGIACNSAAIKNQLTALITDLPNLKVIYRGVDLDTFSPEGPAQGPQVELPPVRFLFLGGFQTWNPRLYHTRNVKGGHVLLEAWQQIEAQLGPSNLLIGGPGTDLSRLRKWRSSLSRPQNVHLMETAVPNTVPALIRASDVVVIPSLNEGLPNLANEAQACGRPVLGTDAGGIPESVVHGETGLVVPKGDTQALAYGLRWFATHKNKIPVMGSSARRQMEQQFGWDRFAQQMESLFHAAIMHRSGNRLRDEPWNSGSERTL